MGLENKSYEERMSMLQLMTLETRRVRDQTQAFEILNKYDNVDTCVV